MKPASNPDRPQWYCVLDPQMKQIYLGTNEKAAREATVAGCTLATGQKMGDAMLAAAFAYTKKYRR